MLLVILKAQKFLECFSKKNCKEQIKKEFRVEKVKKAEKVEKAINYTLNGKDATILLIA